MIKSKLIGSGSYLPKKILTNDELSQMVETNDEWITNRTGIKKRHIAADNELTSDLATNAANQALKDAGLKGSDIDLIIVATTTPDLTFPSTAVKVQANIKANNANAFDMQAVCSGFVYALATADSYIKTKMAKNALIIGAETMSRIVDWTDRNTCVLFGDGAGAFILTANEDDNDTSDIIDSKLYSDGNYADILKTDKGVSCGAQAGKITMNGREVYKLAVNLMAKVSLDILEENKMTTDDLDWIIPHQANDRIIKAVADKMHIPHEKAISKVASSANTSAATIPLAYDQANKEGKFKKGDIIILTALGGGITWGANLLRL